MLPPPRPPLPASLADAVASEGRGERGDLRLDVVARDQSLLHPPGKVAAVCCAEQRAEHAAAVHILAAGVGAGEQRRRGVVGILVREVQ